MFHAVLEFYYFPNGEITEFLLQKRMELSEIPFGDGFFLTLQTTTAMAQKCGCYADKAICLSFVPLELIKCPVKNTMFNRSENLIAIVNEN